MLKIRKTMKVVEETIIDGEKEADQPVKMVAAVAIIENPWINDGYVEDLAPKINEYAPILGELLVEKLLSEFSNADEVEAFGKASVVGVDGEIEHASAYIHTLRFGNEYRDSVEGTSILSCTNKRGGPGSYITIPMVHKTDESKRSHFLTFEVNIPDAPRANEIAIAIGAADGGRPHHRTGDRHQDMKEMGLV